jgi:hypothetical protein
VSSSPPARCHQRTIPLLPTTSVPSEHAHIIGVLTIPPGPLILSLSLCNFVSLSAIRIHQEPMARGAVLGGGSPLLELKSPWHLPPQRTRRRPQRWRAPALVGVVADRRCRGEGAISIYFVNMLLSPFWFLLFKNRPYRW